jgi:bis(5'-nucleosidyl)-tetraphosphatase
VDYWLAYLKDPQTPIKLSHEHQDYKWLNAEEAIKATHDNMEESIRKAQTFLTKSDKYKVLIS